MDNVMPLFRQLVNPMPSTYAVQNITLIPSLAHIFPE
jgi:hypothetical protein